MLLFDLLIWLLSWTLTLAVLFIASILCVLWVLQGYLLYFPDHPLRNLAMLSGRRSALEYNPEDYRSLEQYGIKFEHVYFEARDGTVLHGWFIPCKNNLKCPTIIFFHGNAGNIGHRIPEMLEFYEHLSVNMFWIDYRGYGNSSGSPFERGIVMDAEASLDYISKHSDVDQEKIFIFGTSLGGAIAIRLAHLHQQRIAGLIVENSFTNIDEMALLLLERMGLRRNSFIRTIFRFFIRNHWNSESLITSITIPILFLSGSKDELIPPVQMNKLFDLCGSKKKRMRRYPEGEHNNTYQSAGDVYFSDIDEFLNDSLHDSII